MSPINWSTESSCAFIIIIFAFQKSPSCFIHFKSFLYLSCHFSLPNTPAKQQSFEFCFEFINYGCQLNFCKLTCTRLYFALFELQVKNLTHIAVRKNIPFCAFSKLTCVYSRFCVIFLISIWHSVLEYVLLSILVQASDINIATSFWPCLVTRTLASWIVLTELQ